MTLSPLLNLQIEDMATNAQILSAVINKWAQPLIGTFIGGNVASMPFVQMIENKVRSMGWVSPNWSLVKELSPMMEGITGNLITPFLNKYLSQLDDASIPKMAHGIVNNAIVNGELSLLEGKVVFEESDLKALKRLLDLNLPYKADEDIIIKTE